MEKTLKLILDNLSNTEKKEVIDYLSNTSDHCQNILLCPFCGSPKSTYLYEEVNCSPNFIESSGKYHSAALQFGITNITHMKCDWCTSLFDIYKLADGDMCTERVYDGRNNTSSQYFNKHYF